MILSSNLGYPRIGSNRELKWLLESFWKKEINEDYLFKKISEIKKSNWIKQKKSGINYIPSNDFSLYDHVLDMCLTLNVIPDRFNKLKKENILDLYFAMARGYQNGKIDLNEGLKKLLDDINSVIEYAENHPDDYTESQISDLHKMYHKWSNFNGTADMTMGWLFGYTLKVVEVTESKVVTKILELNHPWVKIRKGDKINP